MLPINCRSKRRHQKARYYRGGRSTIDDDLSKDRCPKIGNAFVQEILKNFRQKFSDEVS